MVQFAASVLGGRSTVGHAALDRGIGVRIPASQPSLRLRLRAGREAGIRSRIGWRRFGLESLPAQPSSRPVASRLGGIPSPPAPCWQGGRDSVANRLAPLRARILSPRSPARDPSLRGWGASLRLRLRAGREAGIRSRIGWRRFGLESSPRAAQLATRRFEAGGHPFASGSVLAGRQGFGRESAGAASGSNPLPAQLSSRPVASGSLPSPRSSARDPSLRGWELFLSPPPGAGASGLGAISPRSVRAS